MNKKKGIFISLSLISLIILTLLCTTKNFFSNESNLTPIQTFEQFIENKDDFILVIESEECGYCRDYSSLTLNHYKNNSMPLPLVRVDYGLDFENMDLFYEFLDNYGLEVEGTPTTILFSKGEVASLYMGVMSIEELKSFMQNN